MTKPNPINVLTDLYKERYPEAKACFFAGSVSRGEGTPTSDLDFVVVFEKLDNAYRDTFKFGGWLIEVFAHDLETLPYFFDMDKATSVPSLATMISEGIEVPKPNQFSENLKLLADEHLTLGPDKLTAEQIAWTRYAITDAIDDLRGAKTKEERVAIVTGFYDYFAKHYFRSNGLWCAQGKTIPRMMKKADAEFQQEFSNSFNSFFETGDIERLVSLAEKLLEPDGGWLLEGYTVQAPKEWRISK